MQFTVTRHRVLVLAIAIAALTVLGVSQAQDKKPEDFASVMARFKAEKPEVMKRQMALLQERYDLGNHPAEGVTMTRGKPVQGGVRIKLPNGATWDKLASMSP